MICIIAATYKEAERWAAGQHLYEYEWFYPSSKEALTNRKNFHTVVVGEGEIPNAYLNELLKLSWKNGRGSI